MVGMDDGGGLVHVLSTHDVVIGEEVEGRVVTNYEIAPKMRRIYKPKPEDKTYSDDEFARRFDNWMLKTTGIKERRWSDVPLEVLAEVAAREAMHKAGWVSKDINYLIVANSTDLKQTPSLGDRVAAQLDCTNDAKVFTINKACAGMIYAFEHAHLLASSSIENGTNAVIVAVERCQDYADWSIATNGPLWGTGSAAACISFKDDAKKILSVYNPATGFLKSKELGRDPKTGFYFVNCGKEGMDLVADLMTQSIERVCFGRQPIGASNMNGLLKFVGPHAASLGVQIKTLRNLGLDEYKLISGISERGNTGAHACMLALHKLAEHPEFINGEYAAISAAGAGIVYGAMLVKRELQ